MIDIQDKNLCPAPTIDEISEYVKNPAFLQFCTEIKTTRSEERRVGKEC